MSASRGKHEWVAQVENKTGVWCDLARIDWGNTATKRYQYACKVLGTNGYGWTRARLIHRVTVEHVVEQMRAKKKAPTISCGHAAE